MDGVMLRLPEEFWQLSQIRFRAKLLNQMAPGPVGTMMSVPLPSMA